jgi:hypothetical protein
VFVITDAKGVHGFCAMFAPDGFAPGLQRNEAAKDGFAPACKGRRLPRMALLLGCKGRRLRRMALLLGCKGRKLKGWLCSWLRRKEVAKDGANVAVDTRVPQRGTRNRAPRLGDQPTLLIALMTKPTTSLHGGCGWASSATSKNGGCGCGSSATVASAAGAVPPAAACKKAALCPKYEEAGEEEEEEDSGFSLFD